MHTNEPTLQLLGCWELRSTEPAVHLGDRVQIQFTPQGTLTYGALEQDLWQIMLLTYRVSGSDLITNQPSAPRVESTSFSFRPDGSLQLEFAGTQCLFERIPYIEFESQLRNAKH